MKYRALDADGDMRPITNAAQILDGADAVGAAVASRLHLLTGEWWEDEEIGFRVPRFLWDGLRIANGKDLLTGYITSYIEDTEGVSAVTDVETEFGGHKLSYSATIVTVDGESSQEVSEDVLLRAVY